ncbi:hypothetical protein JMA_18200 [Jeotgalibacillus malaysiensis]|uniref:Uncharacterized protein n=1 Tax=Jeotgalibacillus malaysiensis TaxID=1508404 RepID=A0A0B5AR55_9BACL|nr:hypothetical protein JMA_18200 [Jeotgalibacillus malaysiensis]
MQTSYSYCEGFFLIYNPIRQQHLGGIPHFGAPNYRVIFHQALQ